jgi:hypothetical protein
MSMKLSLSSAEDDAGSSDKSMEDPLQFLHNVEASSEKAPRFNKVSGPIDVCLNSSAFAESYASGMAESSEIITAIEISTDEDPLVLLGRSFGGSDPIDDSVVANAGNSDIDWSELSTRSNGSMAGNSRQSDIDWDNLSMSTSNTFIGSRRSSRLPAMPMIRETSFSTSRGSGEEDLEEQASSRSVQELTEKLIESFPFAPSPPHVIQRPLTPKGASPAPSVGTRFVPSQP